MAETTVEHWFTRGELEQILKISDSTLSRRIKIVKRSHPHLLNIKNSKSRVKVFSPLAVSFFEELESLMKIGFYQEQAMILVSEKFGLTQSFESDSNVKSDNQGESVKTTSSKGGVNRVSRILDHLQTLGKNKSH
jgi:hypothetical protein